ncbi:MAG TPA: hypothetical protein VGI64_06275 [Streptosporangiaceae bacterium]
MPVAALIAWLITAAGGFVLLVTWLSGGGARGRAEGTSRLPVPVIFGHFGLAAIGLIVWIVFVVGKSSAVAWTGFVILLPVALLGFVMLVRWIPSYRARAAAVPAAAGPGTPGAATAEQRFPVPVVLLHGLLAVVTLILVLVAAIGAH